jgi:hypothetical protein
MEAFPPGISGCCGPGSGDGRLVVLIGGVPVFHGYNEGCQDCHQHQSSDFIIIHQKKGRDYYVDGIEYVFESGESGFGNAHRI